MNETIEEEKQVYTEQQIEAVKNTGTIQDITIASLMNHVNVLVNAVRNNQKMLKAVNKYILEMNK